MGCTSRLDLRPIARQECDGELDLSDCEAAVLVAMSAATIDRRLASEWAKMMARGRSHTKPGSLLKSQIPILMRHSGRGSGAMRPTGNSWARISLAERVVALILLHVQSMLEGVGHNLHAVAQAEFG
jgi:hypothetical protein